MVATLRQFLIVFLVALQVAAPLVHAHVGNNTLHGGLHLHEFEQIHRPSADSYSGARVSSGHQLGSTDVIVELGSILKSNQATDDAPAQAFLPSDFSSFSPGISANTDLVSSDVPKPIVEVFLSQNPSRAPPR